MPCTDAWTAREAADAVRRRMAWKEALGWELPEPGCHASVRATLRKRLIVGQTAQSWLEALRDRCQACGLLTAGGRARTASPHSVAASRALTRLAGVGDMLRAAWHDLAVVAPRWRRQPGTCPRGKSSSAWTTRVERWEKPVLSIKVA